MQPIAISLHPIKNSTAGSRWASRHHRYLAGLRPGTTSTSTASPGSAAASASAARVSRVSQRPWERNVDLDLGVCASSDALRINVCCIPGPHLGVSNISMHHPLEPYVSCFASKPGCSVPVRSPGTGPTDAAPAAPLGDGLCLGDVLRKTSETERSGESRRVGRPSVSCLRPRVESFVLRPRVGILWRPAGQSYSRWFMYDRLVSFNVNPCQAIRPIALRRWTCRKDIEWMCRS